MKFSVPPFDKLLFVLVAIPAGIYGLYNLYANVPPPKQPDIYGLRPCFEEEIRIEAGRYWLGQHQAKSTDLAHFNQMVAAYNQLCAHRFVTKRKRFGVEVIESEVRANRDALWAEGIARFQVDGR